MSEVPLLTPLNYIHSSQQTAPSSKSTTAPSHAQKKTTHTLPVSKALPKTDILKHTYFSFSMEETLKYEYICVSMMILTLQHSSFFMYVSFLIKYEASHTQKNNFQRKSMGNSMALSLVHFKK